MSDNGADNGSLGLTGLIRLSRAAIEEAGLAAPRVLSRFAAQTVLNRTSRRRTIKRVRAIVRMPASNGQENPLTAPSGDVIIPVYNNCEDTAALLAALEADTSFEGRIIIVHDCSTDARLAPMLAAFASRMERVALLENPRNLGFVKSCNRGFAASREDVVILNTDITLPAGAVNRLLSRLQSAPGIATVTPFSNSAYGVGLPDLLYANAVPFGARVEAVDAALQSLMPTEPVNLATGIGFCLAMSRNAIDQTLGIRRILWPRLRRGDGLLPAGRGARISPHAGCRHLRRTQRWQELRGFLAGQEPAGIDQGLEPPSANMWGACAHISKGARRVPSVLRALSPWHSAYRAHPFESWRVTATMPARRPAERMRRSSG